MTNDEAIKKLEVIHLGLDNSAREACNMAIQVLQEEPQEDCISRDKAIRIAEQGQIQGFEWQFKQLVTLPSVKPQRAKGHWIKSKEPNDAEPMIIYTCSNCGHIVYGRDKSNYCPNCGADMRGDNNDTR